MPANPTNPTADGPRTRRTAPATAAERRAAALSFGDIQSRVYEALMAAWAPKNDDGEPGWCDLWVEDLGADWVVVQSWEDTPGYGLYQQAYTLDDTGLVALIGDPVRVDEVSTYVPVAETKSASAPAPAPSATPLAKTASRAAKKPRHRSGPAVGREFRLRTARPEVRSVLDDAGNEQIVVTGSPIVYDTPTTITDCYGEFNETIHAGAATAVLATNPDVRFLFNHAGLPLARTVSGTLTLTDTATALTCEARLDARQQLANDLAIAIERGDVSQMSFGFIVAPSGDAWSDDWCTRDIWQFAVPDGLFDVSAVTFPAYPTTSVEIAQRMLAAAPIQSRARLRRSWWVAREAREGKVLSASNADLLATALSALHEADDVDLVGIAKSLEAVDAALDQGQAGIAGVLEVADPDGDADDQDIELVPAEDSDDDADSEASDETSDGTEDVDSDGVADGSGERSEVDPAAELRAEASRAALATELAEMRRRRSEADGKRRSLPAA